MSRLTKILIVVLSILLILMFGIIVWRFSQQKVSQENVAPMVNSSNDMDLEMMQNNAANSSGGQTLLEESSNLNR